MVTTLGRQICLGNGDSLCWLALLAGRSKSLVFIVLFYAPSHAILVRSHPGGTKLAMDPDWTIHDTRDIHQNVQPLHSLSLHFHINRKTGEVLRVMDRGTNSVVQLLQQILFQVFPALANILIAVFVFTFRFSLPFGLIVFTTMALYLFVTVRLHRMAQRGLDAI